MSKQGIKAKPTGMAVRLYRYVHVFCMYADILLLHNLKNMKDHFLNT